MTETLAICIPTYNRAALLARNLQRLIPEAKKNKCPIYISDNASEDATQKVVEEAKKQYGNIHYARMQKNMGSCKNYENVLNMANTDFLWLLGDDDYIKIGAIEQIVNDIKNHHDIDMIVVNGGDSLKNLRVNNVKNEIFADKNKIMNVLGAHMTWISCLIFSKKFLGKCHFSDYIHNEFPHLWWILANLTDNTELYWENTWCISSFGGGHQMADFFKVFFVDWYEVVYSTKGYENEVKKKCYIAGVDYALTWKECLKLRAKGVLSKHTWKKYSAYFMQLSKKKQAFIKFLFVVPPKLLMIMYRFYKKI